LTDNRFNIDKSVKDLTLLIFRKNNKKATRVILPNNRAWSKDSHPDTVSWFTEEGYDLITIKQPEPGKWSVDAEIDPDNRAIVVTNLKLSVEELPNNVFIGDKIHLAGKLLQEDGVITRKDFLSLVTINAEQNISADEDRRLYSLLDDGNNNDARTGDGVFTSTNLNTLSPGIHNILIKAKGGSFEREYRHSFEVHSNPVKIEIINEDDQQFRVIMNLSPGLWKPDSVQAYIKNNGNDLKFEKVDDLKQEIVLPVEFAGKTIDVNFEATRSNGRELSANYQKHVPLLKKAIEPPVKEIITPEIVEDKHVKAPEKPAVTPEPEVKTVIVEVGPNWIVIILIVLFSNIVLLASVFTVYLYIKRKRKQTEDEQDETFGVEETSEEKVEDDNEQEELVPEFDAEADITGEITEEIQEIEMDNDINEPEPDEAATTEEPEEPEPEGKENTLDEEETAATHDDEVEVTEPEPEPESEPELQDVEPEDENDEAVEKQKAETDTKLEIAKSHIEMGDPEGAIPILNDALTEYKNITNNTDDEVCNTIDEIKKCIEAGHHEVAISIIDDKLSSSHSTLDSAVSTDDEAPDMITDVDLSELGSENSDLTEDSSPESQDVEKTKTGN
jgi:uncharacterized protein (TIGR03503 family)